MVQILRLRQTLVWWLLAVMLLGALAPTVSRARAQALGAAGAGWMEVCTQAGIEQVPSEGKTTPSTDAVMLDHCPMCVLSAERLAPPPTDFDWRIQPQAPPSFYSHQAPVRSLIRTWAAPSRAPPTHS